MDYYIGLCAIVLVGISPLLRRLYIGRFWIHARGTVIQSYGGISSNPGAGGAWVWSPFMEYHADGQRFSSQFSYWQLLNAKPKYKVGDPVEILYNPRNPSRFILDSWTSHIFFTLFISGVIVARLSAR